MSFIENRSNTFLIAAFLGIAIAMVFGCSLLNDVLNRWPDTDTVGAEPNPVITITPEPETVVITQTEVITVNVPAPPQNPPPVDSLPPNSVTAVDCKYTIQPGDTLFAIAQNHGTTVDKIASDSGIANPGNIKVGQILNVNCQASKPNNSFTTNIRSVDFNGSGTQVQAEPGEMIAVDLDFEIWSQDVCPGCIDQIVIVVGNDPQVCAYEGIPGTKPGISSNSTFYLTAPFAPGNYEVWFASTQQYNCADAIATYAQGKQGHSLGTIVVTEEDTLINGYNTTEVRYDSGVFTQVNDSEWVENNSDGAHYFVENGRDEWSIYLQATDRADTYVQLDLWTKEVIYDGLVEQDAFVLGHIANAAAGRVGGWDAAAVYYAGGSFTQLNGTEWIEVNSQGTNYFVETGRDEWSVYLKATDRTEVYIQLDLWTLEIEYSDPDTNGQVPLYTVSAAEPARVDGWNAAEVDYGSGVFTQVNDGEWVENNSEGTHYFVERGRDEWSVYLQATDRDRVSVQLDLWTGEVIYTGPVQSGPVVLYTITDAK